MGKAKVAVRKVGAKAPITIAILDRGWVVIGRLTRKGDACELANAKVIRRWGTTRGLGEIAAAGPTSSTVLDDAMTVSFDIRTSIALMSVNQVAWEAKLGG
jgi:hypothetical protein